MFLNQLESAHLKPILEAVNNCQPVDSIIDLSQAISTQITKQEFPLTYAGILLATHHRILDAIKVLELCYSNPFCAALGEYLKDTQFFAPVSEAFEDTTPYDIWIKTDFYQSYLAGTLEVFKIFAKQNPPPQLSKPLTIIDIGPGNGVLIAEIVRAILSIYILDKINLILIDRSSEMLKAATRHCRDNIPISLNIIPLLSPIEVITNKQLADIQKKHHIWFINAAASLHHLPREIKLSTLKTLQTLSAPCLITEGQANHDLPEKDSPELIYSVAEFYGFFIQDLLKCAVSEKQKKICLYNLVLTEAINILKNDRAHRGDYQALISEWQEIADQAGFKIVKTTATVSLPNSPLLFTMEIHS